MAHQEHHEHDKKKKLPPSTTFSSSTSSSSSFGFSSNSNDTAPLSFKTSDNKVDEMLVHSKQLFNNSSQQLQRRTRQMLPRGYSPGLFDVICARGREAKEHSGNVRFRNIIHSYIDRYANSHTKAEKSLLVSEIMNTIRLNNNKNNDHNDVAVVAAPATPGIPQTTTGGIHPYHHHHHQHAPAGADSMMMMMQQAASPPDAVVAAGGRGRGTGSGLFVHYDQTTGLWYDVGDVAAREKVGQTLRDLLHDQYKSSTRSKRRRKNDRESQLSDVYASLVASKPYLTDRSQRLSEEFVSMGGTQVSDSDTLELFTKATTDMLSAIKKDDDHHNTIVEQNMDCSS